MDISQHLDQLIDTVHTADAAVLEIYHSDFAVEMKEDKSPLTMADQSSHVILTEGLRGLFPQIPIISEEGDQEVNKKIVLNETFWLVDPLDGTREFVARSDQFCTCAGLIVNGLPYFGIVSSPALGITYYGGADMGSFKVDNNGTVKRIHVSKSPTGVVLGSRLDKGGPTYDYIADHYPDLEIQSTGSMLKFIRLAEGLADVYPCIRRPLKLWDIAAGHAILEGAGGSMSKPDGSPIDYHNQTLMAGDFVARSSASL